MSLADRFDAVMGPGRGLGAFDAIASSDADDAFMDWVFSAQGLAEFLEGFYGGEPMTLDTPRWDDFEQTVCSWGAEIVEYDWRSSDPFIRIRIRGEQGDLALMFLPTEPQR